MKYGGLQRSLLSTHISGNGIQLTYNDIEWLCMTSGVNRKTSVQVESVSRLSKSTEVAVTIDMWSLLQYFEIHTQEDEGIYESVENDTENLCKVNLLGVDEILLNLLQTIIRSTRRWRRYIESAAPTSQTEATRKQEVSSSKMAKCLPVQSFLFIPQNQFYS